MQAGAKRKDIQQQALAVRLLHALFGASSQAEGTSTAHNIVGWADELVPGVPALAQLLVLDTSATPQDKSKQSMGQPPGQPAGQVDRAALQLEAAYLLHIILDGLSPQVSLLRLLKADWLWGISAHQRYSCISCPQMSSVNVQAKAPVAGS